MGASSGSKLDVEAGRTLQNAVDEVDQLLMPRHCTQMILHGSSGLMIQLGACQLLVLWLSKAGHSRFKSG